MRKKIIFTSLTFTKVLICLIMLSIYFSFNEYVIYNFFISKLLLLILVYFTLRQFFALGLSGSSDEIKIKEICFKLQSKGWKTYKVKTKSGGQQQINFSIEPNLDWTLKTKITLIFDEKHTTIFCESFVLEGVISVSHFIKEQKLIRALVKNAHNSK